MYGNGIPVKREYLFEIQRRVTANKTAEAWESTPHVSVLIELDVTDLLVFIKRAAGLPALAGVRLTLNSVMLKIIAQSLKHSGEMNAHIQYDSRTTVGRLTLFDDVNIAIPLLTPERRMITPVAKRLDKKSLREVCETIEDLKRRVQKTKTDFLLLEAGLRDTWHRLRRGQLGVLWRLFVNRFGPSRIHFPTRAERAEYERTPPCDRLTADDLLCATVLVSNIGSIMPELHGHFALLEIIAPQTAAIGLAAVRRRPEVIKDANGVETIAIRDVLPMSVCFDHRAMDFEHIVAFVRGVTGLVAHPEELLEEQA